MKALYKIFSKYHVITKVTDGQCDSYRAFAALIDRCLFSYDKFILCKIWNCYDVHCLSYGVTIDVHINIHTKQYDPKISRHTHTQSNKTSNFIGVFFSLESISVQNLKKLKVKTELSCHNKKLLKIDRQCDYFKKVPIFSMWSPN